jgi:integral membrane protein
MAEGISLLTLLFIAMPMKYLLSIPEAVKVVGWIHGGLFILYVVVLAIIHFAQRWSLLFSIGAFVSSLIPFGMLVLDKQLRKKEVVTTQ